MKVALIIAVVVVAIPCLVTVALFVAGEVIRRWPDPNDAPLPPKQPWEER